jgi:hypothetical protein
MYPIATHLRDHLLNYYLVESHNAVDMAQRQQLIKEDANEQAKIIVQVQQFIENQLGSFGKDLTQLDQAAQQFKPQPPMPPDNSMQIAQLNAQLQGQALQQRAQIDQARLQNDQAKAQQDIQIKQAELAARQKQLDLDLAREQIRQQGDDQRTAADLATRERMNSADNQTAMNLAQLEIATGEKFSVSTGTGINPGG